VSIKVANAVIRRTENGSVDDDDDDDDKDESTIVPSGVIVPPDDSCMEHGICKSGCVCIFGSCVDLASSNSEGKDGIDGGGNGDVKPSWISS
jgi:hypothetical protein